VFVNCTLRVRVKNAFGQSNTSNLHRFQKSLVMSIDIVRSIFITLIDSLYQIPSCPAVTHTDTRLLALIIYSFIIDQEISFFCALTCSKVIILIIKA